MSSKNEASSRPWRGRWSISKRLALLFSLSSFVLLILATGYLYFSLVQDISRDESAFLAHKIEECESLLQDQSTSPEALDHEIRIEPAASQFIKYYVRLLDENGRTLLETSGMNNAAPAEAFIASEESDTPFKSRLWKNKSGEAFLLMSARAEFGASNAVPRLLQAAVDASGDEALLLTYRRKLLTVLILGIAVSWIMGLLVARKGLQPLKEITRATDRVSVSLLHERLVAKQWPDELLPLAASFDRMMERLEASFNHLLQFSADLAHEIRTPINNLRGQTGLALSQTRTAEGYRRTLESNLEEYARLSRLIENLLFLARADRSATMIRPEPCSARASILKVVEFYEAYAEDRQIAVHCEGDAGLRVDPALFEQAMSNLLSNALNYTPPGGKVFTGAVARDGFTEVFLTDTGCGIAPEHLPKIFDRFYRIDPARSQNPGGYGLGLAIVKSIVNLHGGKVEVESCVGKGTTFRLIFPQTEQSKSAPKARFE
jgi:two-component system heavy metal sensor histidine kinase CusS